MVMLQCGEMQISVKKRGAELCSVQYHGREWIWNGDPTYWERHCPILFPFCGALKNNEYIYNGVTYPLRKHGFARESMFTLEKKTENSLTFLTTDVPEYKAEYPFSFELRVTFTINENRLKVDYTVANTGTDVMPYAIGAHEGYACPEGVDSFDIVLSEPETLRDGSMSADFATEPKAVMEHGTVWSLNGVFTQEKRVFCFENVKNRTLTLKHRDSGRSVRLDFETDNLLLWTAAPEKFVCLEPWSNFPPSLNSETAEFVKIPGVISLLPGETNTQSHTITFDAE